MISGEGNTMNRGWTITNGDRTTINWGTNTVHEKGIAVNEEENCWTQVNILEIGK